ncbi:MAG: hypothetical protein RR413_08480 [Christensenellaceae bacterium]
MKQLIIPMAACDYIKTRKHLWIKVLIAFVPAILVGFSLFFLDFNADVKIADVFKDYVNVQISAIAILISFSIAIITILVSADNPNIKRLKERHSVDCKPLNGKAISLFQVLLSNITYNVLVEVVYLILLIFCIFLQLFISDNWYKILMAVSVFFIIHILHILLESVGQMYLTFWKYEE